MKTLITGATGFVGHHLAEQIPEAILVGRNIEKIKKLFGGQREARQWDGSASTDTSLLEGVDTVYHLAGESIFHGRWNAGKKERIRASRVDNTRNLVEMISRAANGPKTLICSSAVGYYGSRGDEKLTEQSTPGSDFLARVCLEWEKEALRAEEYGVRVVIVRTGVVLGADGGALAQMLLPFKMGVGGRLGSGRQFMSWIHIDDLVNIMLYAKENASLRGTINAVAPKPVSNRDFTQALASALHRPAILPAPGFALKLLLGEFAKVLMGSQRALPEVLQQAGYEYAHPEIKAALRSLVQSPSSQNTNN